MYSKMSNYVFLNWTKPEGQLENAVGGNSSSAKEAEKDISLCFQKDWNTHHISSPL